MGRAEQYHTRRYGGMAVQEQSTYVAPESVSAPAASDPRPSYGRGADGEYRIGGKTKREAMEEARQAAVQRAIAQGVTNRNKQENAGYDAAKRAKRHWQAEYESQRGFNIPALQAGARPGEQVINGRVATGGLVPNAQSWQSVGGQREAQSQRQRLLQGRASDQEQYRRAASVPGTYRLSDGSVVSSSLAVGDYGNFAVKMRREPVGNAAKGGYLYNTTRLEEQRQVTGFNLFDADTRSALRSNAGQFKTAGEMYGAAQASYPSPTAKNNVVQDASPRLNALFKVSDWVSGNQIGFEQRQARLDRTLSRLSFGKGTPYAQRSFGGKLAQTGIGIVSSPIWGPAALADATGMAGQKSFLYTGALMTPETSKAARQELKGTLPILKDVYSDPSTWAAAVTGGLLYGRYLKQPRSVAVSGRVAITQENVGPGVGLVRAQSTATLKYRAGPLNLYRWEKNVPVNSNLIYHSTPSRAGGVWLTRAESVSSMAYGKKTLYAMDDWAGTYNPKTRVLAMRNPRGSYYFGQEGRSRAAFYDGVSLIEKSNTRSMVLQANRRGMPSVQSTALAAGIGEQFSYNRLPYARARTSLGSINVFGRTQERSYGQYQRTARSYRAGGASTDLFNMGFGDLRRAGLYRDPRITQRPMSRDVIRGEALRFLRNRRGSVSVSSGFDDLLSPRYPPRTRLPSAITRNPVFDGFPIGGFRVGSRGVYGILPSYARRSRSDVMTRPRQLPRLTPDMMPGLLQRPMIRGRVMPQQKPRTQQIPRFDYSPRAATIPGRIPWPAVPPRITIPNTPPPVFPRFPFPGVGGALGGGMAGGGGTSRKYRYAPSLVALAFGIKRKKGQRKGGFTGLELRGV